MSEPEPPGPADDGADSRAEKPPRAAVRADRLGELLPDRTRDESATGWGDDESGDPDERLRREVPPHHG